MADKSTSYYLDILMKIDNGDKPVTDWEAGFLESLLSRKPTWLSDKQINVIERMKEKYLDDFVYVEHPEDFDDDIPY